MKNNVKTKNCPQCGALMDGNIIGVCEDCYINNQYEDFQEKQIRNQSQG